MSSQAAQQVFTVGFVLKSADILSPEASDRLERFLSKPLSASTGKLSRTHKESTTCLPYVCHFSSVCRVKRDRPAKVLVRNCLRFNSTDQQEHSGISELAIDLLAKRRTDGKSLSPSTLEMLDRIRPNGPLGQQV
tara:strand:+ start:105 stop:509 length:405 start_codon:yes stop_codon:yes gene_type:complete